MQHEAKMQNMSNMMQPIMLSMQSAYHMLVAYLAHYMLSHASLRAYLSMFALHLHLI